mgnify:FL=1
MGRRFGNSSSDDLRRRSRRFGGDEESEHQEDAHIQSWSQRTMLWCQSGRHEDACEAYKGDYELALALYDTGNYDAIYLARLIADDDRMTKRDPQRWSPRPMVGLLLLYGSVGGCWRQTRMGHCPQVDRNEEGARSVSGMDHF